VSAGGDVLRHAHDEGYANLFREDADAIVRALQMAGHHVVAMHVGTPCWWDAVQLVSAASRARRQEGPACPACGHPEGSHATMPPAAARFGCLANVDSSWTPDNLRPCGCSRLQAGAPAVASP
jgi:hypothetical protein